MLRPMLRTTLYVFTQPLCIASNVRSVAVSHRARRLYVDRWWQALAEGNQFYIIIGIYI